RGSRRRGTLFSLVLGRACVPASRRAHSRRLQGHYPTPLNVGRVVLHFLWAQVRPASAITARTAISKKRTAECFHSGFATPLRSNPRGGSHRHRDTAEYKNIRPEQTADVSQRRSPPDA